jgi:hypothetical protein
VKTLLLFLFVSSNLIFAQKDKCDKCFIKEKSKNKSSVFSDTTNLVQTKYLPFFLDGKRNVYLQFKSYSKNKYIFFRHSTYDISFKRPFVLGEEIKLGLLFKSGKNYIITFDENESSWVVGNTFKSTNQKLIDEDLSKLFESDLLIKVEVLNPFNNSLNTVKTADLKENWSNLIQTYYNCFLKRIN